MTHDPPVADQAAIEETPAPRRKGPIIAAAVAGGAVVIAGAAYVGGYLMAGDNTPKNATVQGVHIGGLSAAEAQAKLAKELGPKVGGKVELTGGGKSATLDPAQAGLTADYAATVKAAGAGRSWSPGHIVNVLRGGGEVELVTGVDKAKLGVAVKQSAASFAGQPKDASLAVSGGAAKLTAGVNGTSLDQPKAVEAVRQGWPAAAKIEVPVTTTEPAVTTAEAQKVLDEYAKPALSGPITMKTNDAKNSFKVTVAEIAPALSFPVKDGNISGAVDAKKVYTATMKQSTFSYPKGKDASWTFTGGKPTVVPSQDGMGVSEQTFTKALNDTLTKTGDARQATVQVTKVPAKYTTADAQNAGVKEVIGKFTTYYPHPNDGSDYRNKNLGRAAELINDTYLKPGEIFSLNDTLGPRDAAHGFVDGWVISGSKLVKETAGGVSQSSTTVFNAAFAAGLQDVRHQPHTLYLDRYPAGREATLYGSKVDMQFKNNTKYGVLVQAYITPSAPGKKGSITVQMWSTKTWTKIATPEPVKSDFYDAPAQTDPSPDCHAQGAVPGFTASYERIFYQGNTVAKRQQFSWKYDATPQITCTKP